jgi:hypothetical protein
MQLIAVSITYITYIEGERKVGRPPLNVKAILVYLPEGTPQRIDAIAGKNRRGEFIREAVQKELERREKKLAE